ncbi:Increased rDNA silencing protein [Sporothrix curviconia]|uniref:Increased rDNA silencing protein n=1 Tax=Sporothrix curviconia TaxID=1260050 RepID=A0ABP0ATI9_9PEZI
MSAPGGSSSAADNAAATAAALRAASSSRDPSVGSTGIRSGQAGSNLLRPVSPGKASTTGGSGSGSGNRSRSHSTSNSNGDSSQSRSRSRGRNTREGSTAGDIIGSSSSSGMFVSPRPATERMQTGAGGGRAALSSSTARSTSFLAATLAASQAASPRVTPSHTGSGSIAAGGVVPTHLSAALLASAANDERQRAARAASAATLAAAAAASTEKMIRHGIYIDGRAPVFDDDGDNEEDRPDTSAIPATSSLVSIFEKEKSGKARGAKPVASRSPARPPKQKAFTPPRSLSPEPERKAERKAEAPAKTPAMTPAKTPTKPATKPPTIAVSANTPPRETVKPKPKPLPQPQPKAPTQLEEEPKAQAPVPQKTKPIPIPKPKPQPQPQLVATSDVVSSSSLDRIGKLERASTGPSPLRQHRIPLRDLNADADVMERPAPPKPRIRGSSVTSSRSLPKEGDPSSGSAGSSRGPPPPAPPRRSATAHVARHTSGGGGSSSPRRRPSAASTTAAMMTTQTATSVDGLASAIMAGSLAAARHPTSSSSSMMMRSPSSLPSSRSRTPPAHSAHLARSTSPIKRTGMLQTLRHDRVQSDDDDYDLDGTSSGNTQYRRSHYHRDGRLRQGKHHLSHATPAALVGGGRHRHKHHEGARRRWRETVSDRQRRRYEAVWASNRGSRGIKGGSAADDGVVLSGTQDDDETVPNVVVRDLWRRSRLPVEELAEVWDLVDETGTGRLGKAGFVVGLWLIDQRLRGRKIPARVSESVWTSARGVQAPKPRKR